MKLAEGIQKHGFRKWYERELLQSHAHMVLAFLCFVGIFAAFELISNGHNRLMNALIAMLCTATGAWAVRRYIKLLSRAEALANQADCPGCGTYARFKCVDGGAPGVSGDHAATERVRVRCKQCAREWTIEDLL
jgi:hypothetical protein